MVKRRTEGTDWFHIRKWAIGAKAEMEQEDIDREFFDLALQYMSLSGLRKVPDHVALPDDVALWKLDSEFPSFMKNPNAPPVRMYGRNPCDGISAARLDEDGHL